MELLTFGGAVRDRMGGPQVDCRVLLEGGDGLGLSPRIILARRGVTGGVKATVVEGEKLLSSPADLVILLDNVVCY